MTIIVDVFDNSAIADIFQTVVFMAYDAVAQV
jgi:hypothetical protein